MRCCQPFLTGCWPVFWIFCDFSKVGQMMKYEICARYRLAKMQIGIMPILDVRGCCCTYGIFSFGFSSCSVVGDLKFLLTYLFYFVITVRCYSWWDDELRHLRRLGIAERVNWNYVYWECAKWLVFVKETLLLRIILLWWRWIWQILSLYHVFFQHYK